MTQTQVLPLSTIRLPEKFWPCCICIDTCTGISECCLRVPQPESAVTSIRVESDAHKTQIVNSLIPRSRRLRMR